MNIRANFTRNSVIFMLISITLTATVHYVLKGHTDGWQVAVMLLTGMVSSSLVAILCGPWAGAFTGMVYGLISLSIGFFDWEMVMVLTVVFWLVGILAQIGIFRTWRSAAGGGFLLGLSVGMIAFLVFFILLHLPLPWKNIWKGMPQAPNIFSDATESNLIKNFGYLGIIGIVLTILVAVGYFGFLLIWAIGVGAL